jgi:hypothetical protein
MSGITAATGINSVWIKKALDAGVITPDMQPDAIYKAVSEMATGARPKLPQITDQAGQSVRDLVVKPTGMIPFDNGARGFQMGANTTTTPATAPSPGTGMVPATPRGLPGPQQPRIETTAGVPVRRNPGDDVNPFGMSESSLDEPSDAWDAMSRQWSEMNPLTLDANGQIVAAPGRGLPAPAQGRLPAPGSKDIPDPSYPKPDSPVPPRGYEGAPGGGGGGRGKGPVAGADAYGPNPRKPSPYQAGGAVVPPKASTKGSWRGPLAAAAGLGGAAALYNLTDTGGTSELAAESKPLPASTPTTSYRAQAQALIDQLNQMRRAAGGEVPQAKAMMAEINRLLDLSNKQRNAPSQGAPRQGTMNASQAAAHFRQEAQDQIDRLNTYRRNGQITPEVDRQMMQQINHLHALANEAAASA